MYLFLKDFIEALSTQLQGTPTKSTECVVVTEFIVSAPHTCLSYVVDRCDLRYLFEGLWAT